MLYIQRFCVICFLYFRIKPLDILECRMPQNALTRLDAQSMYTMNSCCLFSFKFLNFFSTMGGSISVSVSLEPFLSSNCCLCFVIDSIFSLVKTELKELFRIFALLLSFKLSSTCLFTNGANLSLVLDFVLIYANFIII